MRMVAHAPSVFESNRHNTTELEGDHDYNSNFRSDGYSYGAAPIHAYQTPAPKSRHTHSVSRDSIYELGPNSQKSTDKKRKRQIEDLDLTQARRPSEELDEIMLDVDSTAPAVLHSGLTGGLNRLLSKSKFPPSPDYSTGDGNEPSPLSPVKRSKAVTDKEKSRDRDARGRTSALVKVRKVRRTSDESRPRKHHRSHRHEHGGSAEHHSERPKQKLKALEYPSHQEDARDKQQQLVVFRSRAELFLSFVKKGPESENGCSVNKALKRYHRERGERGLGLGKGEEEKELWKAVRLRRNERGEVVVIF